MKKITFTAYVSDDTNVKEILQNNLIEKNLSIPELIDYNESIVSNDNKSNYVLAQFGMWHSLQRTYQYDKANSKLVRLIELTEDNIPHYMTELETRNTSRYTYNLNGEECHLGPKGLPKFIAVYNNDTSIPLKGCLVLDTNIKEHMDYLKEYSADSLITDCSRLCIKRHKDTYFGILQPLDPEIVFESIRNDNAYANSLKRFFKGDIFSRDYLLENEDQYNYCIDTIKEILNEENKTDYYYNNVFNILLEYGVPTLKAHSNKEIDDKTSVIQLKWDTYIELIDKVLEKTPRNLFVKSLGKFLYNLTSAAQEIYKDIANYLLKKYNLITDEEIEYSNYEFEELSNIDKLKKILAMTATECIYLRSYNDQKSASWNLDLAYSTIKNYNEYILSDEILDDTTFAYIYSKLTDEEKDEYFNWFKRLFKRFLILKELPNLAYALFTTVNIDADYKTRLIKTVLHILNEYKGMEVMTVRSIVNNDVYAHGESIFKYIDSDMKKLKKLVFENKIKQD